MRAVEITSGLVVHGSQETRCGSSSRPACTSTGASHRTWSPCAPTALGPPGSRFTGGPAGVIGAVRAADGTHTARHKMGKDSRQRLPPNADGTNERQLTHLGPRVDPACVDGGTSQR